MIRAA